MTAIQPSQLSARPQRKPKGSSAVKAPLITAVVTMAILLALPLVGLDAGRVSLAALVIIFGIAVMGLDYSYGFGGMMSFGHAAMFGFGAYVAAFILLGIGPNIVIGLVLVALAGALLGVVWGLLLCRLEGVAFAMGTLALASCMHFLLVQWRSVTGGTDGLVALPLAEFAGVQLQAGAIYYISIAIAFLVFLVLMAVSRTRYGLALQAVRDNPLRAEAAGIYVHGHRMAALAVSGAVAAIGGALFVYLQGAVDPSQVHWSLSGQFMIQLLMGGAGTLIGPFIAAMGMTFLRHWLSGIFAHWDLFVGLLVVLFVYFTPRGVIPGVRQAVAWYIRRSRS